MKVILVFINVKKLTCESEEKVLKSNVWRNINDIIIINESIVKLLFQYYYC